MKSIKFFLYLFFLAATSAAQSPNCPANSIYIQSGSSVSVQAVSPAGSPMTPVMNNLPLNANGLAIASPLGFMAPNPTFWTTAGGTFWYYNGTTWINTGHSTGNAGVVNIGGGGTRIYGLAGLTGAIYAYDGSGPAFLVTTVTGFGGPFDIVADDNDNFYLLRTTPLGGQQKQLSIHDANGNSLCSFSVASSSTLSTGTGFGIVNGVAYDANNSGLAAPITPGSASITFSAHSIGGGASDWANCSLPVPTGTILAPMGGTLDCATPSVELVAEVVPGGIGMMPGPPSSTLTSSSYTWSGPGIVSGQGTATLAVNQPGVYTFTVYSSGCPVQRVVKSFTISAMPFSPVINGSNCLTDSIPLSVTPTSNSNLISWSGPGIMGASNKPMVMVNMPGFYSALITNTLMGCSGIATLNVLQSPTISIALSSPSLCAQGFNNSPASITLTPGGAVVYTLLTSPNYSANSYNPWICYPIGTPSGMASIASATVIGSNGFCTNTATTTFSIIPNPTLAVTPSLSVICLGSSATLSVSGASNYTWLPVAGLNTYTGNTVVSNAAATSVYSVYGSAQGCNSGIKTNTVTVNPIPTVLVNGSPTICLGKTATLSASGTAATFTWLPMQTAGTSLMVSPGSPTTYTVKGALNGCTNIATAMVSIVQPPVVSMALSNTTLCAQNLNGSPNSITITPFGAASYTLVTGPGFMTPTPSGSSMVVYPAGTPQPGINVVSATLLGSNGYCSVSASKSFTILPNPVIVTTPSLASICPDNSQVFTVSGADTYTWATVGGGLNSVFGSSIVVTPTIANVYSVVGSSMGCSSGTKSSILNLLQIPTVSVSASSPTICSGSSVTLSAMGNSALYTWLSPAGVPVFNGASMICNPLFTQSYTVIANNTCTNGAVVSVSVIQSPTIAAAASSYTICEYGTVYLNANGANSYHWAPVTGANSINGSNITATPGKSTLFTVWGSNGTCTGSTTVFVKTVPSPDVQVDALANQVCPGASVAITAKGAQSLAWFPASSLSSNTGSTVIAWPASSTNYTIVGINSDGTVTCSQQVSYSVMVAPLAVARVSGDVNICAGGRTGLRASGGNTYSWTPGAGLNKTDVPNITASPSVATVYTVHVSYNGNCGSSATVQVLVHPNPFVYAGRDTTFNRDEPMNLNASGDGILTWISGNGILCSGCPDTRITPRANGCYIVEAVSNYGCKAQDEVCITLTDLYEVYIPNSFTPNNDGLNDVFMIYGTGISELTMEIYDRWGERLFSSSDQATGWNGNFKGEDCNPGVYVYSISYKGLNFRKHFRTGHVTIVK